MRRRSFFLLLTTVMLLGSCSSSKSSEMSPDKNEISKDHIVLNGQIVNKEFVNKGGKNLGFTEMYLRCSVQDYFIKFCESTVTKKEIEALNLGEFDGIKVEAEIIEGEWDSCDPTVSVQSRIGKYVVIYKLL